MPASSVELYGTFAGPAEPARTSEQQAAEALRSAALLACGHPQTLCDTRSCDDFLLVSHGAHFGFVKGGALHCLDANDGAFHRCTLPHDGSLQMQGYTTPPDSNPVQHDDHLDYLADSSLLPNRDGVQPLTVLDWKTVVTLLTSHTVIKMGPPQLIKTKVRCRMCCAMDEAPIVDRFSALPGVENVTASAITQIVTVTHDAVTISSNQILREMGAAGLEPALVSCAGMEPKSVFARLPPWYVLVAACLTILSHFSVISDTFKPLKGLAFPAIVLALPDTVRRAYHDVRARTVGINALLIVAVAAALAIGDYQEAALVVTSFALANWLEQMALNRSRATITAASSLKPETAVRRGGLGEEITVDEVKVGDFLIVKHGEKVPVDGVVVTGASGIAVEESTLTGEAAPVSKRLDDPVYGGTISTGAYFEMRATRTAENSSITRLTEMIEQALQDKSTTQLLVERVAKIYTPVVIAVAVSIATIGTAADPGNASHFIYLAAVFLIAACPCSLVLSTPVTFVAAIAAAAHRGVLVHGGRVLESMAALGVVVFDKTGTLTTGDFTLDTIQPLPGVDRDHVLKVAALLESQSQHPLAIAILKAAKAQRLRLRTSSVDQVEVIPGMGIKGIVDGQKFFAGSSRLPDEMGWFVPQELRDESRALSGMGVTEIWVGSENACLGFIGLSDQLRRSADSAIRRLKRNHDLNVFMFTGDSWGPARKVAARTGIDLSNIHAQMRPDGKLELLRDLRAHQENARVRHSLRKRGGKVAMVGDGANDGPALATADVGVAMGVAGSAAAMEAGNVVLFSNDLSKVADTVDISHSTQRIIMQNVVISFAVKLSVLGATVVGLGSLWMAVFADVIAAFAVIFNGTRVYWMYERQVDPEDGSSSCFYKATLAELDE